MMLQWFIVHVQINKVTNEKETHSFFSFPAVHFSPRCDRHTGQYELLCNWVNLHFCRCGQRDISSLSKQVKVASCLLQLIILKEVAAVFLHD